MVQQHSSHLLRFLAATALAGLIGFLAVACSPGDKPDTGNTPRSGKLKITATIGMIADVAGNIAGDHAEITGLMGPGVDPHLYKATQGDLQKLSGADLVLYNGLHLEGKMSDIFEKMASRVPTVAVTDRIPHDKITSPPEFKGQHDPHVWFDVKLWMNAAERIRDALIEVDAAHKEDYARNAEAYLAKMKELDAYATEQMATIPSEQRVLVTAHDAFGYFGRAYGIEVMGLQGISTAAEYGLHDLEHLATVIAERKIKAVFVESSVPKKSIEALVRGVEGKGGQVRIGGELFSDAMGAAATPEGTYLGMVRHNVDTIVKALR